MTVTSELCRVTIVAPHTRMDIALPSHVPLAELQQDLLHYASGGPDALDLADAGAAKGGWVLARLGKAPLNPDLSPRQLGIVDGEELFLQPYAQTGPEMVFDDVIDAVATAAGERAGRWQQSTSRAFGIGLGTVALLGGAAAAIATGGAAALWTSLAVGVALLLAALVMARALGSTRAGTVFGLVALAYGFVGGSLLLAEGGGVEAIGAPHLLTAGTVVTVFAVIGGIVVPRSAPVFHAAVICGVALTVGAALCTFLPGRMVTPGRAAVAVAVLALAFLPALPMFAYRVARLPMPTIPTSPQQLRTDAESVDGELALKRSERADEHLTALLATVAAIAAAAEVLMPLDETLPAALTTGWLALLLLVRARVFPTIRQRLPLLLAGVTGLGSLAVATMTADWADTVKLPVVLGGLIALALIALGYSLSVAGKRISPSWGRALDIGEILLIVGVVPLALWVWDVYWTLRTISG
ncbi:type VII secretion integral membrane protein EccD [Actinorhabdospora filicis]|uniref:Type VII secretion integral membrane protein EccD n=1 Tax=Actinorhabdospora filicis TaxID=1785913 RepID=A0A9W6ST06_9ACTN|nr:type VII secretion integral membrane protein EccD [Actinorhabdospora filicis]GLZ81798.1 type VII secretion integral membrane protein EccD [Actinorhabdospora filicis]